MSEPFETTPAAVTAPGDGSILAREGIGHRRGRRGGNSIPSAERTVAGTDRSVFFQPVPVGLWIGAGLLALWSATSANPGLSVAAILMLPVMTSLLWFRGEPPILLFACVMQWIEASVALLYANYYGATLIEVYGNPAMVQATWLSLGAIMVLAIGMRVALIKRKPVQLAEVESEAVTLNLGRVFVCYLVVFVLSAFVSRVAWAVPALTQPLLAFTTLRWALVFLLGYAVFTQHRGFGYLGSMVFLEFFTGIIGYFSGFKNVFFILFVVLLGTRRALQGWKLVLAALIFVLVLALGIVWSVIKEDYRDFLNQGSGMQEVVVPVSERIDKLKEIVGSLNQDSMEEGVTRLISRLSYVHLFGYCLMNVPPNVPHQNGRLWLEAVEHVFMPRLFFPNKPVINDSDRTIEYTGITVATGEEGTSIGIGYIGESYIDFGRVGMFAPIFLMGAFYGVIYRYFSRSRLKVLGLAIATGVLIFNANSIASSNIKVFGGCVTCWLAMGLFLKFLGPWFWNVMTASQPARARGRRHQRTKATRSSP